MYDMNATKDNIRDKIKQIAEVPTIPVIVSKLIKIMQNENSSIEELSEIISHDQSIASKIVAAANSPFFGYPGKINSIEQAILMLGFDFTKSIALGVSVFSIFQHRHDIKKVWAHSYGVATLSGLMCPQIPVANKGICFLAGLLHDIGRALFIKLYSSEYAVLLTHGDAVSAEMNTFSFNHTQLGGWFLEGLSFPDEIVLPVFYHHGMDGAIKHKGIVTAIYLAEGLISVLNPDIACDGQWTNEHEKVFKENGLAADDIRAYDSVLHDELQSMRNFFEL